MTPELQIGDRVRVTHGPARGAIFTIAQFDYNGPWDAEGRRFTFDQVERVLETTVVLTQFQAAAIIGLLDATFDFILAHDPPPEVRDAVDALYDGAGVTRRVFRTKEKSHG